MKPPHPDDPRVPPPQLTPAPYTADRPEEPITGEHDAIATTAYVKTKQAAASTQITKYIASADLKWFAASMAGAAAVSVLLVGWFDARGAERQLPLEKRVEKLEATAQQQALEAVRTTTMLENLSRDRGLPVPPPAPKVLLPDGGTP